MSKTKLIISLSFFALFLALINLALKIYFQPVALVVPHHNVVQSKRLEYFNTIAQKRPITQKIIIIGPDHFSPIQTKISYSNSDWNLPNGNIDFAKELEPQFKNFINLENGLLQNDHTIYNLLPDIKSVWSNSTVFPILIGQGISVSQLDILINQLTQVCGIDCLLVSSVDFSHYLPSALADIHDQKSIYDLSTQNLQEIPKLEVDSPQSLYVLVKYSQLKNAQHWNLFHHSNSGQMVNDPDVETTSHVFGLYHKSFFQNSTQPVETYLIAKNINKNKSYRSLGERFFYGTDFVDLNYSSVSSFYLPFDLPADISVAVIAQTNQSVYTFFPFETKKGAAYLLRGDQKKVKIQSFFSHLQLKSNCQIDQSKSSISCINNN